MLRCPWRRETGADRRAEFEALTRAHAGAIFSAALRFTRNRDDAQDLCQDAIRAFTRFETFTPETNFKAWILRLMTNLYISEYCRAGPGPFGSMSLSNG